MPIEFLLLMLLVCLIAAAISAIFGLAGGMLVFLALGFGVDLPTAIALHAAIQLVSNGSRILLSWRVVRWRICLWFALPVLPAAYLGGICLSYANADLLEIFIAAFVLLTVFLPKKSVEWLPQSAWWFAFLGALSSFLGMLVAATGPLIAAFFNMGDLRKEALVATKAVSQGITQAAKLLVLSSVVQVDFSLYGFDMLYLSLATIVGTWLGNRLIHRISDGTYDRLNNALLAFIALLMIAKVVWRYCF